jgi:hypothetical protein
MSKLFRENITKYYFYKYGQIGMKIPEIIDVIFRAREKEVDITTKEEIPSKVRAKAITKASKDTCLYTFDSETMGLNPISKTVSFR